MSQQQASRTLIKKKALILKGGGVKGIALAGAYKVLADYYEFDRFAGASAGAIGAAFLAAGCTPDELLVELTTKDFSDFCDSPWYLRWPRFLLKRALHSGNHFQRWVAEVLGRVSNPPRHPPVTMAELPRATLYSSDSQGRLLIDSKQHAAMTVDLALRCSMAIPYFFDSMRSPRNGTRAVDGGVRNNFPVDAVKQDYKSVGNDFIAIYLGQPRINFKPRPFLILDLLAMWLGQEEIAIIKQHRTRTVVVPVAPIGTTEFSITPLEKAFLAASGKAAAMEFLEINQVPDHPGPAEVRRAKERADELHAQVIAERRDRRKWLKWLVIASAVVLLVAPLFGELCGEKSCTKPFDVARDAALQPIGGPYACKADPPGCHQPYAIPLRVYGPIESVQYQGVPPKFDGSPPKWVVRCPDTGGVCGPQGAFLSTPNGEPCEGNTTCYAWFAERHGVSVTHRFIVTYGGGYYFYNTGLYALWRSFRSWAKTALQT